MRYYVYIIEGADDSFYTGITTDVERRLHEHNGLRKGGAKYTRKHRPYSLVYLEEHPSRSSALAREHVLKQLTHVQKAHLIRKTGDFPSAT
jgi:putative endonuclease